MIGVSLQVAGYGKHPGAIKLENAIIALKSNKNIKADGREEQHMLLCQAAVGQVQLSAKNAVKEGAEKGTGPFIQLLGAVDLENSNDRQIMVVFQDGSGKLVDGNVKFLCR